MTAKVLPFIKKFVLKMYFLGNIRPGFPMNAHFAYVWKWESNGDE